MILFKDIVIVLRTNQTKTTILDELKLASIATSTINSKNYEPNHRIFIESKTTKETNSAKIVIDGIITVYTDNVDMKTFTCFEDKRLPLQCNVCKLLTPIPLPPLFLASKPTILIHVIDKSKWPKQHLGSKLDHCFSFLATYKFSTLKKTTPIKQVIISLKYNSLQSLIKIVIDGQIFYDGSALTRWNEVPERYTCTACLESQQ